MTLKAKVLFAVLAGLLVVSITGCLLAVVYQLTPRYMESRIIPELAAIFGETPIDFKIRRIQVDGTDLGPIVVGDPQKPALAAQSIHIDYNPGSLYRKRIERIVVSGVTLRAMYQDGKLSFPGIDMEAVMSRFKEAGKPQDTGSALPVPIFLGGIELIDATILLTWNHRIFRLPAELRLTPQKETLTVLDFLCVSYLRDGRFKAKGHIDLKNGTVGVDYLLSGIGLERYADMLPGLEGIRFSGNAEIEGRMSAEISPFHIAALTAHTAIKGFWIATGGVAISGATAEEPSDAGVTTHLTTDDGENWKFSLSGLKMAAPVPIRLRQMAGQLKIGSGSVECSGDYEISMDSFTSRSPLPLTVPSPINSNGRFNASWASPGHWGFMIGSGPAGKIKSRNDGFLKLKAAGIDIQSVPPQYSISGSGTREKGVISYRLDLSTPMVKMDQATVRTDRISLKGNARIHNLQDKAAFSSEMRIQAPKIKWRVHTLKGTVPSLTINAKASGDRSGVSHIDGLVKFTGADLSDPVAGLHAEGIRLRLPLVWPLDKSGGKGTVSVTGIKWQERAIGSVAAVISQQEKGFSLNGTHVSALLQDLKAHFSGRLFPDPNEKRSTFVDLEVPDYTTAGEIELGTFDPAAEGLKVGGIISGSGRLSINKGRPVTRFAATVKDGRVLHEEMGFSITGIETTVKMTDLLQKRSESRQLLKFQQARMGELSMGEGKVEFQVESPGAIFIEKSSFKWCGGLVDAHALRISPEKADYHLVLYCDRLVLHQVLEQFGAVQAEGSGTLNGKIPIRFKEGRLRFDDGFLYSSPGQGGTIRLTGTEMLTAGIPKNTVQYNQLELAREALKDYTYKWVKLRLTTEGETLLLRMQMDGKPANPLPFVYDQKIGGFIRVKAGSEGSIFQGISLDVNFRLPLDRILTYKEILKNIEQ